MLNLVPSKYNVTRPLGLLIILGSGDETFTKMGQPLVSTDAFRCSSLHRDDVEYRISCSATRFRGSYGRGGGKPRRE